MSIFKTPIKHNESIIRLAQTNCSIELSNSALTQICQDKKYSKKRIGPYSYYFKNLIGSGYSSKVYRGIKDDNKNIHYAIKVLKLKQMNIANQYLLQNEIQIMKQLNHPHILKILDVYRTSKNCYIITQYCNGGTLEKYIKSNENIDWGNIIYQIGQTCKYLSENNIAHRDLKPANVFLKNGKWIIGDFGFSKRIPHRNSLVVESYKVGSPLYMPLQILQRNLYSAKSDSFALGVMIYYLILKQFPWNGNNMKKLIHQYKNSQINWAKLEFLPSNIVDIIKGLCKVDMRQRWHLADCDFGVFLNQKSIHEIQSSFFDLKPLITNQVKLCQFINYLMKNSMLFLSDDHILYSMMSTNLYHLTEVLKWSENKCLADMKKQYILPEGPMKITEIYYRRLLKVLEETIYDLTTHTQTICQVGLQKFLQYYFIVKAITTGNSSELISIIKQLILHKNFVDLIPNTEKIANLMVAFSIKN